MTVINDIKITNPTAEAMVRKFSKEEVSELFSSFLILVSKGNIAKEETTLDASQKTRWAEFAEKMDGIFTPDMVEHIDKSRKEARDNFIANI